MDIRNRRGLKAAAGAKLSEASYQPRKLALIHVAVSVGVALVVTFLDYYLSTQIEVTGGLSGMGMRTVLGTVQMTLSYLHTFALPFWEIGFVFAALQIFRAEPVGPKSLLEGFRKFGSVLRLRLMEAIIFVGVAILCTNIGSFLFMATPFSKPMVEMVMPLLEEAVTIEQMEAVIAQIPVESLMEVAVPFLVIFGVLFLLLGGFLFYRFRVADFVVMDAPRTGALQVLALSSRMTRKNRLALLRLDLSFWWFYALTALTLVIGYLDLLLPLLGIRLPMTSETAWFVFYVLGMLAQLVLFWYCHSYVQTTYAAAYETLRQNLQEQQAQPAQPAQPEQPKPVPQNLPWDQYET